MSSGTLDLPVSHARPDTGRDYLSFSAIRLYQGCPLRFHFKYNLGLPEDSVSSALVLDCLGLGANKNNSFAAMVLGLVGLRAVRPYVAGAFYVHGA